MTYPTETIRLTRDQVDVLLGRVELDYEPEWVRRVRPVYAKVAVVDTVEESTPHTEGWLAAETPEWVAQARAAKVVDDEQHRLDVAEAFEHVMNIRGMSELMERIANRWE